MADNFANVPFPITGTSFDVKVNYQINTNSKEKKRLSLSFKFQIVENKLTSNNTPSVAELFQEFNTFLLRRLCALLGRNVQITSMSVKCGSFSFLIPLYFFGQRDKIALPPETAMFFLLQPLGKSTCYRLYLKGGSASFSQKPLPESELKLINEFETLFTSSLAYLNGLLVLKIVRGVDELISATFRELKKFAPRKQTSKSKSKVKKNRKPKSRAKRRNFATVE